MARDRLGLNQRARAAFLRGAEAQALASTGRSLTDSALRRVLEEYPGDPDDVLVEPSAVVPAATAPAVRINNAFRGRDVILMPVGSPPMFRIFALDVERAVRAVARHGGTVADLELVVMTQATKWGLSAVVRLLPGRTIEFEVA